MWRARCKQLTPSAKHTDILGTLLLAEDLFANTPKVKERRLITLSDMRQSTSDLDLETVSVVPDFRYVRPKIPPLPNFRGVTIYVMGVEEINRSTLYWLSLRKFWEDYCSATGAVLKPYTVLRETSILSCAATTQHNVPTLRWVVRSNQNIHSY